MVRRFSMGRGHDSTDFGELDSTELAEVSRVELVEVRPRLQFSRANARIRWRHPTLRFAG